MALPALIFGGATTDAMNCGAATTGTLLFALDPMTLLMWCMPTTLTTSRRLATTGNTTSRKQYLLSGTAGNVNLGVNRATTGSNYITSDTPLATLGKWKFIAFAYRSSANPAIAIYHGDLTTPAVESTYGTATDGSGATSGEIDGQMCVGNLNGGTGAFQGSISTTAITGEFMTLADARIWQYRMLNPMWRAGPRYSTKCYWRIGWGGVAGQPNLAGQGYVGTLTGTVPGAGPLWLSQGRGVGKPLSGGAPATQFRRTLFARSGSRGVA